MLELEERPFTMTNNSQVSPVTRGALEGTEGSWAARPVKAWAMYEGATDSVNQMVVTY